MDSPNQESACTAPPKMDPHTKELWVSALRSGAFKQATGLLFHSRNHGFCCLGVLRLFTESPRAQDSELLDPAHCGLPEEVQQHLAAANDGDEMPAHPYPPIPRSEGPAASFADIANWVETWL